MARGSTNRVKLDADPGRLCHQCGDLSDAGERAGLIGAIERDVLERFRSFRSPLPHGRCARISLADLVN